MITDDKFRKSFTVQINPKSSLEAIEEAWRSDRGCLQTTLREARDSGLRPEGKPALESTKIVHEGLNTQTCQLAYAVDIAP